MQRSWSPRCCGPRSACRTIPATNFNRSGGHRRDASDFAGHCLACWKWPTIFAPSAINAVLQTCVERISNVTRFDQDGKIHGRCAAWKADDLFQSYVGARDVSHRVQSVQVVSLGELSERAHCGILRWPRYQTPLHATAPQCVCPL